MAESNRLGHAERMEDRPSDWTLIRLSDGEDELGNYDYWHDYQHKDGRVATQFADGTCSDPGLAQFLAAMSANGKAKTLLGRVKEKAQGQAILITTKLLRSLFAGQERRVERP